MMLFSLPTSVQWLGEGDLYTPLTTAGFRLCCGTLQSIIEDDPNQTTCKGKHTALAVIH